MNNPTSSSEKQIPLERVGKFIRQLTHDVRNGLSAIDLETAFIAEISTDEEVLAELQKLREMIAETAKMLRRVSQHFHPVSLHPIPWTASTVLEEIRKGVQAEFAEEAPALEVENRFGSESVEIDLQQTQSIVVAVIRNALQFHRDESIRLKILGRVHDGQAVIELHEPAPSQENPTPPEAWGREPLLSTRPGGYGLELFQARQIAESQGGSLEIELTGGELVTRLTLPGGGGAQDS